ncbi:response regulator [Desulforhabdus amnigena]|jgi:DNA-binding response OmpR family regulator|uniref:Response regulator n=1 Tax=Desulforhabdus amnigena TaxID=40218 RepID=A0A9W6CVD3_9BACT|nr:response regulator [Desulforhabdus amnigena]NLJ29761.1 response regulator [Deltaproteobacteria bacterium]GLI33224.1 response regulator [Desulforhabdus amnigena]
MSKWKVLLVDDEVEFVTTLSERLNLRGVHAQTAFDGEEALRCLEEDPPQVVVLDMMMPGLGGLEVLQRIRKEYPQIPVILLTGHSSTRDGMEGMRLGAFDYLMKPLNIGELIEKIGKALESVGGK